MSLKTFVIVMLFLLSTYTFADFNAQVVRIIDGDTIDVLDSNGKKLRIRLLGIDTPEQKQQFGYESTLYLKKIDNLKLYGPELDRTRLIKWADIVVCSDHCSMLFEGMILKKKVVAIHSRKVRPFAIFKSKIHGCDPSMNSIYSANDLNLDELTQYTSDTRFIDEYCWGGLGKIDLGKRVIRDMITND